MDLEEKTIASEVLYRGKIVNLRKDKVLLPNGREAAREVIEHPGGVCVAPLTDGEELLFVRQFRYPFGKVLLELPAGKLDRGEAPLACGKRELKEEAGAAAADFVSLGKALPSPGCYGETLHLFLARGLTFGEQSPDEDEFLELVRIPLRKAVEMVTANEIEDAKTQIAVMKTWMLLHPAD